MAPATEFQVVSAGSGAPRRDRRPPAHAPAPADEQDRADADGALDRHRARRHRPRRYFWLGNRKAAASVARSATPILHAAAEQVLRRRALRRRHRAADQAHVDARCCGKGPTRRSSTARSTASARPCRARALSLRRLQSGSIRAYAASLFLGVVLILGWYLTSRIDAALRTISFFLPLVGALLVLLAGGRGDRPEREGTVRAVALAVSLVAFAATLFLWWRFNPADAGVPVRREPRLAAAVRHLLPPRRGRHQPVPDRPDRLPDAARAALLVAVGAQERSSCSRSSCSRSRARCSACSSRSTCSSSTSSGTRSSSRCTS